MTVSATQFARGRWWSAGRPANERSLLLEYRAVPLALFVTAGLFKTEPWLAWIPIDFTLSTALLVSTIVLAEAVYALRVPPALTLVALLFASYLPCLLWTRWTPFAEEKLERFFTLTLLATIAPLFLIRTRRDVHYFLTGLCCLGMFIAANAAFWFLNDPRRFERIGAETTISTVSAGQMAGVATLWITVLVVNRRFNLLVALALIGLLATALIGIGSRGPLVLLVPPLLLVCALHGRSRRGALRLAAIGLTCAVGLQVGLLIAPELSTSRVEAFVRGEFGSSEVIRSEYLALSLESLRANPLGIGLGGFSSRLVPWATGPGPYAREYPHNIFLEVGVEAGWAAGLIVLLVTGVGFARAWKHVRVSRMRVEYTGLFVVFGYMALADSVSGGLPEGRLFFALLGTALGLEAIDASPD